MGVVSRVHCAVLSAAFLVASCSSLRLDRAGELRKSDWLTEGANVGRTHVANVSIRPPLAEDWVYNAAAGFGPGSPLLSSDYVIVGTRRGEVHAVSADKGKKQGSESFGDAINGSPAISGSMIIVPVAWGRSHGVVGYDMKMGSTRWKYRCAPVEGGILLVDDHVVFADADSRIHAVSLKSGTNRWIAEVDDREVFKATPVLLESRMVAIGGDRGHVYGLDLTSGAVKWIATLGAPVYATPATDDNVLFVPTARGRFIAVDGSSGQVLWTFDVEDPAVKLASPALTKTQVIFGSSEGVMRALDRATARVLWEWSGSGAITSAPLVAGDVVYFGTMARLALALDRETGNELWSAELRGRVKSAPSVDEAGVYFLSEPRFLYRFVVETGT